MAGNGHICLVCFILLKIPVLLLLCVDLTSFLAEAPSQHPLRGRELLAASERSKDNTIDFQGAQGFFVEENPNRSHLAHHGYVLKAPDGDAVCLFVGELLDKPKNEPSIQRPPPGQLGLSVPATDADKEALLPSERVLVVDVMPGHGSELDVVVKLTDLKKTWCWQVPAHNILFGSVEGTHNDLAVTEVNLLRTVYCTNEVIRNACFSLYSHKHY